MIMKKNKNVKKKNIERELNIVSGGLLECIGTIRRIRWALYGALPPEIETLLAGIERTMLIQVTSMDREVAEQFALAK